MRWIIHAPRKHYSLWIDRFLFSYHCNFTKKVIYVLLGYSSFFSNFSLFCKPNSHLFQNELWLKKKFHAKLFRWIFNTLKSTKALLLWHFLPFGIKCNFLKKFYNILYTIFCSDKKSIEHFLMHILVTLYQN